MEAQGSRLMGTGTAIGYGVLALVGLMLIGVIVVAVLDDDAAAREVEQLKKCMDGGQTFDDALAQGALFDPLHRCMIRMDAEVGREDQVMANLARSYEEEVSDGVARMASIIESTLVAFLCIVIGAVLLSVMLPMAGMISSIL